MRKYFFQIEAAHDTAPLSAETIRKELRLPEGWRIVDEDAVKEPHALGEVFTYALLLWPAVGALFLLESQAWQLALKMALAVWLGLFHLIAYRGAGGRFLGNSMLMLSACVAAFCWSHPGPWMYLWLAAIVIGMYAAVRGVLRRG